jgi:hypothetical protein
MHVRLRRILMATVMLALAFSATASATFNVTDEHSGQTFGALTYLETPYMCGAPCVFTFTAVQGCGGNSSFSWAVQDAAGNLIESRFGPLISHYQFSALGLYSVLEGESSQNCGTGGTFRVQVVDRTPPETTITSGPAAVSADPTPSFAFSASEPGATFECRLDALAFSRCSSPTVTPPLADGAHVLAVRATDAAGNTDPTPATYAFTIRRPTAVTATLRQAWRRDRRSTAVRRLELRDLPAQAHVTVTCSGRGCPFKTRRFTPSAGAVSLTAAFGHARLAARAAIAISVDAPGAITRQFRLTMRAFPWDPRLQVTCVPATAC